MNVCALCVQSTLKAQAQVFSFQTRKGIDTSLARHQPLVFVIMYVCIYVYMYLNARRRICVQGIVYYANVFDVYTVTHTHTHQGNSTISLVADASYWRAFPKRASFLYIPPAYICHKIYSRIFTKCT